MTNAIPCGAFMPTKMGTITPVVVLVSSRVPCPALSAWLGAKPPGGVDSVDDQLRMTGDIEGLQRVAIQIELSHRAVRGADTGRQSSVCEIVVVLVNDKNSASPLQDIIRAQRPLSLREHRQRIAATCELHGGGTVRHRGAGSHPIAAAGARVSMRTRSP